jgi:hypothetical protein
MKKKVRFLTGLGKKTEKLIKLEKKQKKNYIVFFFG